MDIWLRHYLGDKQVVLKIKSDKIILDVDIRSLKDLKEDEKVDLNELLFIKFFKNELLNSK